MKAQVDKIIEIGDFKLVKVWGQSINSYIVLPKDFELEAYTIQCEGLLALEKRLKYK